MDALAVMLIEPHQIRLRRLPLREPGPNDVVVAVRFSGISSGTERLLYSGRMPWFPGLGYPLVPGYESVGEVIHAPDQSPVGVGQWVFVPGADCHVGAAGLFGGASSHLVTPATRVVALSRDLGEKGVLLALAATAMHALGRQPDAFPELIVGHGVLGRLMSRLALALGGSPPKVWETRADRRLGAQGYEVVSPDEDPRHDYSHVCDVSGDPQILDQLVPRLARKGLVTLAGFYETPVLMSFAPAFQREVRLQVAAQWDEDDLAAVSALISTNQLDLGNLISHRRPIGEAVPAYRQALTDPDCLKMVIDWKSISTVETNDE